MSRVGTRAKTDADASTVLVANADAQSQAHRMAWTYPLEAAV
jgi:hypothetical protein